ncbi:MAG: flagellar biosynthesis protein FlhF [Phycisphaerales bacterium]
MSIKTYRASSVHEALAQVKKDLGPEAVILHTRTYKTGGVLGLKAKTITEITASSQIHVEPRLKPRRRPEPAKAADPRAEIASPRREPVAAGATSGAPTATATAIPERFTPRPRAETPAREVARVLTADAPAGFQEELAAIKRMVGRVLQNSSGSNQGVMPEALNRCYLRMIENEVTSELADEIAGLVRDELSPNELRDASIVQSAVLRRIAQYIPVNASQATIEKPEDGRPLTIALAGPTGVGKTTTIAKLAATYKLRHGKSVGLITCDTYRIAAVDQLRTYANIIGVPLHVALTPHEVERACESLRECDAILIDTAGRSQRDAGRIDELGKILAAANPHQTHLVLSMATSESVMHQAVDRFAAIKPDRVIFTKLDEAVNFGALVNIARKVNAELSFVTNGQEVPDHIEPSNADRLARLVLTGEAPS